MHEFYLMTDDVEAFIADMKTSRIACGPARNLGWGVLTEVTLPGGGKEQVRAKADPFAVNELVAALLKAKPTAHPELSSNPAVHGLQPPGLRVTLRQGCERASTINFGDVTSGGKAVVFVTTSARPDRPMATPRGGVDALFRESGKSGKAVDLAKWASDFRVKNGDISKRTTEQSVLTTKAERRQARRHRSRGGPATK